MNERITSLYAIISNNEVIVFNTNLKAMVADFNTLQPLSRNYDWFYRSFKKEAKFVFKIGAVDYYCYRLV